MLELKAAGAAGGLPATVIKSTYVGNHMEYVVRLAQGEWFATSGDVDTVHEAGSEVSVHFRARGPVLLSA